MSRSSAAETVTGWVHRSGVLLFTLIGLLLATGPAVASEWVDYFKPGDAELSTAGYNVARAAAAAYALDPTSTEIMVVGHMDAVEGRAPEARFDVARARAMLLELLYQGVPLQALNIEVQGTRQMARVTDGPDPLNRRVTVRLNKLPPMPNGRPRPPSSRFGHYDQPLIFFDSGSSELSPAREADLVFALRLSMYGHTPGEWRVLIWGFADTVGDPADNLVLSQRRAETVARVLARHGMPWADMEISGTGETQLARATRDEVAEPLNRRVQVRYNKKAVSN